MKFLNIRPALLILALLALMVTVPQTHAQQIYTTPYDFTSFVGAPGGGYADSDAVFDQPFGVAVSASGTVYVCDGLNQLVEKVDSAGNVTVLAGQAGVEGFANGPGSSAEFYYALGAAVDSAGNVYVADEVNQMIRKIDTANNVTTYAGSGAIGAADGPGSTATFQYPVDVAIDSAGNLYVADEVNSTVRKIDTAQNVTTIAGQANVDGYVDGPGSTAQFYYPVSVAVDSAGNVYVADLENSVIRKIDTAYNVTTWAGDGTFSWSDGQGTAAEFNGPEGVATDSAGNVYVGDSGNDVIRKIDTAQNVTTIAGFPDYPGSQNGNGYNAYFDFPRGLGVDSAGNIYVADRFNDEIRKIDTAYNVTTLAGVAGQAGHGVARFSNPTGGAIDSAGNIYVADYNNCVIRKINSAGTTSTLAGTPGVPGFANGNGTAAEFYLPWGVAVDSAGNVYVADRVNCVIRKIDTGANVTTYAGTPQTGGYVDGPGSSAEFNYPTGVAVDSAGNVYVADSYNAVIRKIDTAQNVTTYAGSDAYGANNEGNGPGTSAYFDYPLNLTVDSAGNVYVVDFLGATVRKIDTAQNVTTIGGTPYYAGYVDGPSSGSYFNYPAGVAVDNAGNVYVADSANNAIRRIDTAGNVSTLAGGPTAGSALGIGSAAQFNTPKDVLLDSAGNLHVVDQSNERISEGVITAPTLISATRSYLNATLVTVVFNQPVTAATATTVANYTLNNGGVVTGATLSADGMTATLTTSPIFNNMTHVLTVNSVQAATVGALTIANGSQITISLPADTIRQEYSVAPGTDVLVLEAEDYNQNTPGGGDSWVFTTSPSLLLPANAGANTTYSGTGTMQALPSNGRNIGTVALGTTPANTPCLSFSVLFTNTGTFYAWVRGVGDQGGANLHRSVYIGLDNVLAAGCNGFLSQGGYIWSDTPWPTSAYEPMTVSTPGFHTINVWMRQDGFDVDKLLLTDNSSYTPVNLGPAESPSGGTGAMSGPAVMVTQSGASTVLWWNNGGTLQSSTNVAGPYTDTVGSSPFTVVPAASPSQLFYRVRW